MGISFSERTIKDAQVGSGREGNRMSTPITKTNKTTSPEKKYNDLQFSRATFCIIESLGIHGGENPTRIYLRFDCTAF
jgi:hypothetical protein